jgi:hypothetical protein
MRNAPLTPTLTLLASVLPEYGQFPFDRTVAAARADIGSHPDPSNAEHARRLLKWLNDWLCRIAYPTSAADPFADSLAMWWHGFGATLPPEANRLANLTDPELQALSRAYGDLYVRVAAVNRAGPKRRVGPTAAAKLLYFVRPCAVTAWDKAISLRTGGGQTEAAFLRHLETCREWAKGPGG